MPINKVAGILVPDSKIAFEAAQLVRDCESELLLEHSLRIYFFGAFRGKQRGWDFDPELLYLGAMFHDVGLTEKYRSAHDRFKVDGAPAVRQFLEQHGMPGIFNRSGLGRYRAPYDSPGIPWHKRPETALVTAGVEMDVLGQSFDEVSAEVPEQVISAHPRRNFKKEIIRAVADGIKHKPETAFGNVKADVLERMLPGYVEPNFCRMISDAGFDN